VARYLAIDYDPPRLHVLAVGAAKGHAKAEHSLTVTLDEDLSPATAERIGKGLRDALKQANLAPAPVLWSIGRDRVVLKELTIPPTPAHEEPAIVRFQAAKESTEPLADTVIDYSHLGPPIGNTPRRVLAVLARRQLVQAIGTICHTAGLKLQSITPRPFAAAGLLSRKPSPASDQIAAHISRGSGATRLAPQVVLLPTANGTEFLVYRGHELSWARTFPASSNLTAEVQRTLLLMAGQNGADAVERILAPATVTLGALPVPVEPLDPWLDIDVRPQPAEPFLACLGLAEAAKGKLPINLSVPKEPKPVVDNSKRQKVAALIAVAVLIPAIFIGSYVMLTKKNNEIARLTEDKEQVDADWKDSDQDRRDVDGLKEWEDTTVSWIDELYDVAARLPHVAGLRITTIQAVPITRRSTTKEKDKQYVARLTIHGQTTGDQDTLVTKFTAELRKDPHLRPAPADFHGNDFTIKIDVAAQPGSRYTTHLVVPKDAKRPVEPPAETAPMPAVEMSEDDIP
jgi:hypothetical protein